MRKLLPLLLTAGAYLLLPGQTQAQLRWITGGIGQSYERSSIKGSDQGDESIIQRLQTYDLRAFGYLQDYRFGWYDLSLSLSLSRQKEWYPYYSYDIQRVGLGYYDLSMVLLPEKSYPLQIYVKKERTQSNASYNAAWQTGSLQIENNYNVTSNTLLWGLGGDPQVPQVRAEFDDVLRQGGYLDDSTNYRNQRLAVRLWKATSDQSLTSMEFDYERAVNSMIGSKDWGAGFNLAGENQITPSSHLSTSGTYSTASGTGEASYGAGTSLAYIPTSRFSNTTTWSFARSAGDTGFTAGTGVGDQLQYLFTRDWSGSAGLGWQEGTTVTQGNPSRNTGLLGNWGSQAFKRLGTWDLSGSYSGLATHQETGDGVETSNSHSLNGSWTWRKFRKADLFGDAEGSYSQSHLVTTQRDWGTEYSLNMGLHPRSRIDLSSKFEKLNSWEHQEGAGTASDITSFTQQVTTQPLRRLILGASYLGSWQRKPVRDQETVVSLIINSSGTFHGLKLSVRPEFVKQPGQSGWEMAWGILGNYAYGWATMDFSYNRYRFGSLDEKQFSFGVGRSFFRGF